MFEIDNTYHEKNDFFMFEIDNTYHKKMTFLIWKIFHNIIIYIILNYLKMIYQYFCKIYNL